MNIKTGEIKQIITKEGNEGSPEWSPDDSRILFMSDRGNYFNLFTVRPDGTEETQITNFGQDDRPSWSPTGKTIILRRQITESSLFSGSEIVTIDAIGSNSYQLTNNILLEDWPTYSRDGKWILFSGDYGTDSQLIVIPISGGTPAPLYVGGVFGNAPDWIP